MENKKTGYPHIDKPWMKYYEGKSLEEIPNKNLVEVLRDRNKYRMSRTAYEYYKSPTSYEEMFNNVDNASKVLSELGVKEKDIAISLVPNTPEEENLLYGANQLGAAIDYFDPIPGVDPKASAKKLLEAIIKEQEKAKEIGYNMKYIIAFNMCYLMLLKPIENELKDLGFNDVILLDMGTMNDTQMFNYMKSVLDFERLKNKKSLVKDDISVNELKYISSRLKEMEKGQEFLNAMIKDSPLRIHKYSDLVRECENSKITKATDPDLIASIGHTSGTSGALPKPITLTHKQILASMRHCDIGGLSPNENETVLHFLPGYAHFGRQNNGTQTYYSRATNIHIPEFPMEDFAYLVKEYKPNVIMGTPAFLTSITKKKYMQDEDLSFITKILYGGDAMRNEDEEELNKFLSEHNCRTTVEQAYGLSETAGGITYAKDDYKRPNSIGIPMPDTIITLVDPSIKDRLEPLKFEEDKEKLEGEFAIYGEELTDAYLLDEGRIIFQNMPNDGLRYLRTGDVGYMDKDGISYSLGRKDRGFIRYDGYNVRPYEIEPEIENNKYVKNARIVPYYDEAKCGNMPMCHLTLNNEELTEEEQFNVIEDIVNNTIIANPNMDLRQIPSKFKIRKTMPYSKNNKIDFRALEKEVPDGEEINVLVDQTNVSTGGIEIFKKKEEKVRKR